MGIGVDGLVTFGKPELEGHSERRALTSPTGTGAMLYSVAQAPSSPAALTRCAYPLRLPAALTRCVFTLKDAADAYAYAGAQVAKPPTTTSRNV